MSLLGAHALRAVAPVWVHCLSVLVGLCNGFVLCAALGCIFWWCFAMSCIASLMRSEPILVCERGCGGAS